MTKKSKVFTFLKLSVASKFVQNGPKVMLFSIFRVFFCFFRIFRPFSTHFSFFQKSENLALRVGTVSNTPLFLVKYMICCSFLSSCPSKCLKNQKNTLFCQQKNTTAVQGERNIFRRKIHAFLAVFNVFLSNPLDQRILKKWFFDEFGSKKCLLTCQQWWNEARNVKEASTNR